MEPKKFNQNTYISIGLVALIVAATLWIKDGQVTSLAVSTSVERELVHYKEIQKLNSDYITAKLETLSELVKANSVSGYTNKDHNNFIERLQEMNPTLHVPKSQK